MHIRASLILFAVLAASGCGHVVKDPPQSVMYRMPVGAKTAFFEVTSPNSVALRPGVRAEIVAGPCGPKSGIMLMQDDRPGGYIACGCHSAMTGSCQTVNDNPEHPSCSGGCRNSEGLPVACEMYGMIGPPRNPVLIQLLQETRAPIEPAMSDQPR
jgi:hypothetical protein